ncbi:MAG: mannose-6-phosphate isomerase, class I [Solitalea-like symbiont of Acarus siro]
MSNPPSNIIKIQGKVKSDNWGGHNYIAELLSIQDRSKPYSEYWLGLYHSYPSTLLANKNVLLIDYLTKVLEISRNTLEANFPFLLKVLDVEKMISIQLHPNSNNAREGFIHEDMWGQKTSTDSDRIYKDLIPKYEALFSISDFYLLQGFLERELMIINLDKYLPIGLKEIFIHGGNKALCEYILELSDDKSVVIIKDIFSKLEAKESSKDKSDIEYWILKYLSENTNTSVNLDKGFIFMCLLNLIKLNPGEVIYTKPGILHSYLYGKCAEVMSNSDNVIRLGLTSKSINHKEILNNLNIEATTPTVITPSLEDKFYRKYIFREANFSFTIIGADEATTSTMLSIDIEIILSLKGCISIKHMDRKIDVHAGEAVVITSGTEYIIEAKDQSFAIIVGAVAPFIQT